MNVGGAWNLSPKAHKELAVTCNELKITPKQPELYLKKQGECHRMHSYDTINLITLLVGVIHVFFSY